MDDTRLEEVEFSGVWFANKTCDPERMCMFLGLFGRNMRRAYSQSSWPQSQAISGLSWSAAFSQWSLQYLLSLVVGQLQNLCPHVLISVIIVLLWLRLSRTAAVWGQIGQNVSS